jgi:hypothetical protein
MIIIINQLSLSIILGSKSDRVPPMVYTRVCILTGYVLPLLNALLLIHQSVDPKRAIGFTFNGLVTHVSKFPCQAT